MNKAAFLQLSYLKIEDNRILEQQLFLDSYVDFIMSSLGKSHHETASHGLDCSGSFFFVFLLQIRTLCIFVFAVNRNLKSKKCGDKTCLHLIRY